ncbi:uncharacterized protein TNCV_1779201 [Trichonephila clavipes]|nr:uncharacterized protein TNCV_1779201 [Trichonephila clavipes]
MLARMSLRRQRNHYQQRTEFEQDHVMGLREGGFSFHDIAERLGRNVSTVHDFWEQWSRNSTASRRPGSGWPRGPIERKDHHMRRTVIARRNASAAEKLISLPQLLRLLVPQLYNELLKIGYFKDSCKTNAL